MLTKSVSWFPTRQREVTDEFECVRDTRLSVQVTNELVNISWVAREITPGKHDRSLGNAASEMQRLVQQENALVLAIYTEVSLVGAAGPPPSRSGSSFSDNCSSPSSYAR
jgi:hypothetical protein